MDIITRKVDNFSVGQRNADGYINATALTAAHRERTGQRKDVSNWLKSARAQESIAHLSSVTGIAVTALYQVVRGGANLDEQGTWIHPRLAVRFAIWVSDEFGYMVEQWVEQWVSKDVAEVPPQPPITPILPTQDRLGVIEKGISLLDRLGGLDERTKIALSDCVRNVLFENDLSWSAPAKTEQQREWTISDRVVALGYKPQGIEVLKGIGAIVGRLYRQRHDGQEPSKRGQYVDGAPRSVNSYTTADLDIVDQAIRTKLGEPPTNIRRLPPA